MELTVNFEFLLIFQFKNKVTPSSFEKYDPNFTDKIFNYLFVQNLIEGWFSLWFIKLK